MAKDEKQPNKSTANSDLRLQGAALLPDVAQPVSKKSPISPSSVFRAEIILPLLFLIYPLIPGLDNWLFGRTNTSIGSQLTLIFIFSILAIGLNVVVGYSGLLHLGIAAFFGIGAYITGILTVPSYPFQFGFWIALAIATFGAGLLGVILAAPTLRLRGDYLALVTLGFGEVVRFSIRNFEEITAGTRGLNPLPAPVLPFVAEASWKIDYRWFYYLTLAILLAVLWLMRNLERSRLGRAWIAVREDELAATCMGINAAKVKLSAFALSAALAGLAGGLYATKLTSTAGPDAFDFNRSMIMLCCIILGGLGSLRGTLLGVLILIGFDNVLAPILDGVIQQSGINASNSRFLVFSNWRMFIFGMTLILIMRYRPMGLLPARMAKAA